jgi:hypothetical protein
MKDEHGLKNLGKFQSSKYGPRDTKNLIYKKQGPNPQNINLRFGNMAQGIWNNLINKKQDPRDIKKLWSKEFWKKSEINKKA